MTPFPGTYTHAANLNTVLSHFNRRGKRQDLRNSGFLRKVQARDDAMTAQMKGESSFSSWQWHQPNSFPLPEKLLILAPVNWKHLRFVMLNYENCNETKRQNLVNTLINPPTYRWKYLKYVTVVSNKSIQLTSQPLRKVKDSKLFPRNTNVF